MGESANDRIKQAQKAGQLPPGTGSIRYSLEGWGEKAGDLNKQKDDSWLVLYVGVMASWAGGQQLKMYDGRVKKVVLSIPADTEGEVRYFGDARYELEQKGEQYGALNLKPQQWRSKWESGTFNFRKSWRYRCSREGKLVFWRSNPPQANNLSGKLELTSLNALPEPDAAPDAIVEAALIDPVIRRPGIEAGHGGRTETNMWETEGGVDWKVVGGSYKTGGQTTVTEPTKSESYSGGQLYLGPFEVEFRVTGAKTPEPPKAPQPLVWRVYFETGKSNADKFPHPFGLGHQMKALQLFMESLEKDYGFENISSIEVHGHASGLADWRDNRTLSKKRADYVAEFLRTDETLKKHSGIEIRPKGEPPVEGNDKDNNLLDRSADVVVKLKPGAKKK